MTRIEWIINGKKDREYHKHQVVIRINLIRLQVDLSKLSILLLFIYYYQKKGLNYSSCSSTTMWHYKYIYIQMMIEADLLID